MSKYAELFKAAAGDAHAVLPDEPARAANDEPSVSTYTILFVDDEDGVLSALRRIFMEEDYNILTATSATAALNIMEEERVHLIISDHRMPGMTGAQLLKEIKRLWPDTIRIMLTGFADVQSIMGAVNEGAVYKFITKPWNDDDLRLTISLALQQYALIQENKRLREITQKQQVKLKNYSALFDEDRGLLGKVLVKAGILKQKELDTAQNDKTRPLADTLVKLGLVSEPAIVKALQNYLKIDYIDLREAALNPIVVKFLPRELCERNRIIPVALEGRQITLAMADPTDIYKCDNITHMTGMKVVPLIAGSDDILAALEKIHGSSDTPQSDADVGAEELTADFEPLDEIDIVMDEEDEDANLQEVMNSSDVPAIIRIVNAIMSEAVRYGASDIHIEPKAKHTLVRYRIDGMLQGKIKVPPNLHQAIISRIKILSKMDISERRKPQDGRITVKAGVRIVDIRVSTMPTINGEKVVMRILDKGSSIKRLDELGLPTVGLFKINALIRKPQGIIISTGPTGSGKTTMLYSILSAMMQTTKNFETIEDPVEYFLEDANQVFVRDKIGLSFASVLRATLRQDPDVILVGEIRDHETADVAFKAALTGHMVLTTLHTNNSIASITRLIDMGVKPYLLASAIEGIVAQRLVRRVCDRCSKEEAPDPVMLDYLNATPAQVGGRVRRGVGCPSCGMTGYHGRTGIFEIFTMNDDFRHIIATNYKELDLINMARASGMKTLLEDGYDKVRKGETTLDELVRVVGAQTRHERICYGCARTIDAKYIFCPFCGAAKQNFCRRCSVPLEEGWATCPFCGTTKDNSTVPTKGDTP